VLEKKHLGISSVNKRGKKVEYGERGRERKERGE